MIAILTYLTYVAISISVTVWVAKTLHKNGRAFLVDAFRENETLADSINHLLVVGFYLINLGYMSFVLKMAHQPENTAEAIEMLSAKIGLVLIVLGAMHFLNIYVFSRFRKSAMMADLPPPVEPDMYLGAVHSKGA